MAVKKVAKKKKPAKPKAKKAAKKIAKKPVKKPVRATKKQAAKKSAKKTIKKAAKKTTKPGTTKMKPATASKRKEHLMKLLLKKRNEVVQDLEAQMGRKLTFDAGQKIDSAMDSGDQSSADVDSGIDYSLTEMKYEQYKDIADAFRKLEDNTYGQCEECGEEIALKRLEVNPLARYCIACKTQKEALEKIQKEETRFKE